MITKEQALAIAEKYLKETKTPYTSLDKAEEIKYMPHDKIPYGKKKGEHADIYSVCYGIIWGIEERSMFLSIEGAFQIFAL